MKKLLVIPLLIVVAAAAGYGVCRAAKWEPHLRELIVAMVICIVAGMMALVPALLARSGGVAAVSQSGLLGTIVHMFLAILLSAVAWVANLAPEHKPYLFWLLMFYWVSLVAVVIALAGVVRQTAAEHAIIQSPVGPVLAGKGLVGQSFTGQRAVPQPNAAPRR